MNKDKLRAYAREVKKGYTLMKEGNYAKAKEAFFPFVQLMRQFDKRPFRLFYAYSLTQFYTGDIEGFFETYGELQQVTPSTEEEKKMKQTLEDVFFNVREEMSK